MTIDKMPLATTSRILAMIAYGCFNRNGFDVHAYSLFLCRMTGLLPVGEGLPEFRPTPEYPIFSGDDIDSAAYSAAKRLTLAASECA